MESSNTVQCLCTLLASHCMILLWQRHAPVQSFHRSETGTYVPISLLAHAKTLSPAMPAVHAADILSCGMQRLTTGQWFTSRVSACGLFATAYVKASATVRQQLRSAIVPVLMASAPMSQKQSWDHQRLLLAGVMCKGVGQQGE